MIFEELKLKNFGIYQGEHTVNLDSTDHEKPIILFGGLNGGGKTTFLDSLQLALYGKHAKCSNRGRLSYSDYLKQTINHYTKDKSAYVALTFRHSKGTSTDSYEVIRSWSENSGKDISDIVKVNVNGKQDHLLTDNWDDFVSEFIPQSMSELFFFDGEKIEDLADPARSSQLIKTGIEALLGLELFSQLSKDLNNQRQKRQERNLDNKTALKVEELLAKKESIIKNLSTKTEEIESILDEREELRHQLEIKRFELQSTGAHLLDSLNEIQGKQKHLTLQIESINNNLIRTASSALPLLLAKKLFNSTYKQAKQEQNTSELSNAEQYIAIQNKALLNMLDTSKDKSTFNIVKKMINTLQLESKEKLDKTESYLHTNPALFPYAYSSIENESGECKSLIETKSDLAEKLALINKKLEAIPDYDSVKDIIDDNKKIEHRIEQNQYQLETSIEEDNQAKNQLQELESRLDATLILQNSETFEQKRNEQVASHLSEMKKIIDDFKSKLIQENIEKLEAKIKSKFSSLERKAQLITRVKINPQTFNLTLIGSDAQPLKSNRLSAGERQLLSVAILWALADESGKEIPTIIDTPMGRLDGKHRTKLVEDYFPQAAGQVILLSTDEEITGQYYKKLKKYIAKEYHISYNEDLKTSTITSGYFVEEA